MTAGTSVFEGLLDGGSFSWDDRTTSYEVKTIPGVGYGTFLIHLRDLSLLNVESVLLPAATAARVGSSG